MNVGCTRHSQASLSLLSFARHFLNFKPNDRALKQFRTDFTLRGKNVEEPLTEKLRLIYLVLPYFDKDVEECENDFDCWIYLLKNMTTLERMPFLAQNAVFRKLALITDITTLSKADREKYDYSLKNMRDHIAIYTTAEEKGFEKGRAQGHAEGKAEGLEVGRAEGRAEGHAEGLEEGEAKGILKTARNFKAIGISYKDISKATGLTYDEIEKL